MERSEKEWFNETQKEISLILGNVPLTIGLIDQDMHVRKFSKALMEFTKRKEEDEIIGLRGGEALRCIHHTDVHEGCGFGPVCNECPFRKLVLDTFKTGESYHKMEVKFSFEDDDVEQRTLLLSTALLDIADKKVLVFIEDITDRAQAEEKITETNRQLKEINKKLLDAYALMRDWKDQLGAQLQGEETGFLLNKTGVILGVTQRTVEITGWKRMDIVGSNFIDLLQEDSKEKFKNGLKKVWKLGFMQIKVDFIFNSSNPMKFVIKLMPMNIEGEGTLLLTMQSER